MGVSKSYNNALYGLDEGGFSTGGVSLQLCMSKRETYLQISLVT